MRTLQHLERFLVFSVDPARAPLLTTDHLQGPWALLHFPVDLSQTLTSYMGKELSDLVSRVSSTHGAAISLALPLQVSVASPLFNALLPFSLHLPEAHLLNLLAVKDGMFKCLRKPTENCLQSQCFMCQDKVSHSWQTTKGGQSPNRLNWDPIHHGLIENVKTSRNWLTPKAGAPALWPHTCPYRGWPYWIQSS